jgi:PAS domain-containing protein
MSRAIASIGTGPHERLLKLAARSFRPYAKRHGYELHLRTEVIDASRPAPWSKVRILRDLLDRHDTVVWLDSDLMILDPRADIAADVPADRFLALVEHRIGAARFPNSGVMVLRPDARAFLDEVWAQDDLVGHRWWENAAICRLLGYELEPEPHLEHETALARDHTHWLDARWNSIPDAPAEHPRIRHYPGYKTRTRAAFMLRDLVVRRRR